MKLNIDLNLMRLVQSFTGTRQVKLIEAKRGDTLPVDLAFALDGAEQQIPAGAVITFAANAQGAYDTSPVVLSSNFSITGAATKALATASLGTGTLVGIEVLDGGTGYTESGPIVFSPSANGASAVTVMSESGVGSIDVMSAGRGYDGAPDVTFDAYSGTGHPAVATAIIDPVTKSITRIDLLDKGAGYTVAPTVTISGGNVVNPGAATAVLKPRSLESVELENAGSGFAPGPKVVFTSQVGSPTSSAKATAYVVGGKVTDVELLGAGEGYGSVPPRVTLEHTPSISVADEAARILTATYVAKGKPLTVNDIILNAATSVKYKYLGHTPLSPTIVANSAARVALTPVDGAYCYQTDTPYSIYKYVVSAWTTLNLLAQEAAWSTRIVDATAEVVWGPKVIQGATLTEVGMGYSTAPTVVFDNTQALYEGRASGQVPVIASAIAHVSVDGNHEVKFIEVQDGGAYFGSPPYVHLSGGLGSGATAEVEMSNFALSGVEVVSGGSVAPVPDIILTVADPVPLPPGFVRAELIGHLGVGDDADKLASITVVNAGYGYSTTPAVSVSVSSGGVGTGATATATMNAARVVGVKVNAQGSGYLPPMDLDASPTVAITGGGSGATAIVAPGGLEGYAPIEDWFYPSPGFVKRVGETSPLLVPVRGLRPPIWIPVSSDFRNVSPSLREFSGIIGNERLVFGSTLDSLGHLVPISELVHAGYYQPSTGRFIPDATFISSWTSVKYPSKSFENGIGRSGDLTMIHQARLDVWNLIIGTPGTGYTNPTVALSGGSPIIGSYDYALVADGSPVQQGVGRVIKARYKGRGYYSQFGIVPRSAVPASATVSFTKAGAPPITRTAALDVVAGKIVSITLTEAVDLPADYVLGTITLLGTSGGTGATFSVMNSSLSVSAVAVTTAGSGYTSRTLAGTLPVVFSAGAGPGSGAAATAYFEGGVCKRVLMTAAGTGYISTPLASVTTSGTTPVILTVKTLPQRVTGVRITNGGSGYVPYRGVILSSSGVGGAVDLIPVSGKASRCEVASPGLRYESGASIVFPLPTENHIPAIFRSYKDSNGLIKLTVTSSGSGYYEGSEVVYTSNSGFSEPIVLSLDGGRVLAARYVNQVDESQDGQEYTVVRAPLSQAKGTLQTSPEYIAGVRLTSGGEGYNDSPVVVVTSDTGAGAEVVASASFEGKLEHVKLKSSGDGYAALVNVEAGYVVSGSFAANPSASIYPVVVGGYINSFVITEGGEYNPDTVSVSVIGGGGAGAQATPVITEGRISSINLTNKGSGYTSKPWIRLSSNFGRGSYAEANVGGGSVSSVKILNAGTNFSSSPTLTVNATASKNAVVRPILSGRGVSSVAITLAGEGGALTGGLGYTVAPTVTFSAPTDVPRGLNAADFTAQGRAFVMRGKVVSIIIDKPGDHYVTPPTVTISNPPIGLSGLVSLDSVGLNALFGIGGAPDVSVVDLNAEIAIVTGASPPVKMTTETFTLRVHNDILR